MLSFFNQSLTAMQDRKSFVQTASPVLYIAMALILSACGGGGGGGGVNSGGGGGTVVNAPGAPGIGTATAGDAQATVSFTAPASNGGATITNYTVTSSPGGLTANGPASPLTVTGLTNGTAYTFTVTATNSAGTGPASATSNSAMPVPNVPPAPTSPGAPGIGTATTGNAQATVSFTPPAFDGGAAITGYTATSSPGGLTASGPASPLTVTGLTNGTTYTFSVTATNSAGTGAASASSNSVTPVIVPGSPGIGTATAGNAQATVTFTAPTSDGGATITIYTVTSSPGGLTANGPASPLTVTGLTNGVAYTFSVTATNTAGTGSDSASSNSVMPVGVPGPPGIGTATAGEAQATITFTPPTSVGGATITSYTVTSNPGGLTASGPASPLTVTGLTSGTSYTFTVTATNSAGTGPASATSNSVTPIVAPVVSVSATEPKELTFTWAAVDGATHYKLLKNPDNASGYTQLGADLPDTATSTTDYIGVHLHDWVNASYIVQACNVNMCAGSSAVFTTSVMLDAIGYFKASNTGGGDRFGYSVSLSANGMTMAVGAPNEASSTSGINSTPNDSRPGAGAVYIFNLSGSIWNQQAYIKASNNGSDSFGNSVSLSADGDTLAVGAPLEDSSTTGINSTPNESATNSGAAYVFIRSGSTWSQQAYVKASNTGESDAFGTTVSLSGDGNTLAVGAHQEASSTTGINSTPNNSSVGAGAVYVFTRNNSSWSQQAYIKASKTRSNDFFGWSLSLSGDGNTLAVGAYLEDSSTTGINSTPNEDATGSGAAFVFTRNSSTWSQEAYIKAFNTGTNHRFGYSVSLSADGDTLAIGAYDETSNTTGINSVPNDITFGYGAVYVFSRNDSTWNQQVYIKASNTGGSDRFGVSVSLSADGDTLAVGAYLEDSSTTGINSTPNESATNSGAAYVFIRSGSTWSQQAYVKASNTGDGDEFGISVSLSAIGDTLAVGAYLEDSSTTGINSTPNESVTNSGAVYLY